MKSGGSLLESLAAAAVYQVLNKEDFEELRETLSQLFVRFKDIVDGPVGQVVSPFGNSLLGVLDRIGLKIGLGLFLGEVKGLSKKVAVVVDEADPCLRELSDGQSEMSKSQSELNTLIEWAQDKLISLVLISSDFTLPFRLQAAGFDRDIGKVMIIGEVLEPEMLKMLQDWGMDVDLAEKFYAYFGGDIFTTKQALDMLIDQKEAFDPFAVIQCPGLGSCVKDPKARTHLELMAKQGFSLVEDVKADEGARLIEQANVGVLIAKGAIKFNLPAIFADTGHQWAVVPPSYHMKVKGEDLANVDDLKEAIKQKIPPTVMVFGRKKKGCLQSFATQMRTHATVSCSHIGWEKPRLQQTSGADTEKENVQTVCAKPLASHQAQALLRDMREHGLSANKVTIAELLSDRTRAHDAEGVWRIVDWMQSTDFGITNAACSILLKRTGLGSRATAKTDSARGDLP
eukprot:g32513.t1